MVQKEEGKPIASKRIKYTKLLESLFEKGISPGMGSVIEGLSNFFKSSYYDALVRKEKSNLYIAKSIGDSLVECLKSPNYRIVEVAAACLRNYINSINEIPFNCIQNLLNVLERTVPSSAMQAALTLGCIACTKPSRLFQLPGIRPIDDVDRWPCWKCRRGYQRGRNAKRIVPTLIKNLNRPISRDKSRKVRWSCAIALGGIGYTMPRAVLKAIEPLRACLKEGDGRDAVIFALGCIGYTRPDVIDDLIPVFQKVWTQGSAAPSEVMACGYALKKVGMETNRLLSDTYMGKRPLSKTMEIFFERMKEYEGGLVDESIDAIIKLAKKYPNKTINCLNQKLKRIHKTRDQTGHLIQNISITIKELSQRFFDQMEGSVPLLVEHFKSGHFESYRTLDSSAIALKTLIKKHPEWIPPNIVKILESFLKDEKRGSVIENTSKLLKVVKK